MLCVISPAKKLDETIRALPQGRAQTQPMFPAATWELVRAARALSAEDLSRLMGISPALARLNADRFAAFRKDPDPALLSPALMCFAGDTYVGLDAASMGADALHWAEGHLRILSGLYGLLRPGDGIQPYRLEMGSRLKTAKGPDLYTFWGDRIARALNAAAKEAATSVLVNCASVEYFTAANRKALNLRVITPVFLDEKAGESRVVSFWAKRARGAMARFLCDHHLTDPADLRAFATGGYAFRADLSEGDRMVFHRAEPETVAA